MRFDDFVPEVVQIRCRRLSSFHPTLVESFKPCFNQFTLLRRKLAELAELAELRNWRSRRNIGAVTPGRTPGAILLIGANIPHQVRISHRGAMFLNGANYLTSGAMFLRGANISHQVRISHIRCNFSQRCEHLTSGANISHQVRFFSDRCEYLTSGALLLRGANDLTSGANISHQVRTSHIRCEYLTSGANISHQEEIELEERKCYWKTKNWR